MKTRKFDTKVQHLKFMILREVARHAWDATLVENLTEIPMHIVPGNTPTMRCCVYKERAILGQRVKLAIGGHKSNPNVIEVIDIACDECPVGGYEVTNACRGCLAHRCENVCPMGAISFDRQQKAFIDKTKCIECGKCAQACQFQAIMNFKRPCELACKTNAISMSETKAASIDADKCTECGACAYLCPFGAISDKSYILDAVDIIKKSDFGRLHNVYAVIAPAFATQFNYAKRGQLISGIRELGFTHVVEAALGADIVAVKESHELLEKGVLTSSCCPAFVSFVKKEFPELEKYVSTTPSPMIAAGEYIKKNDPSARVVFIGPCTAKKDEINKETNKGCIDAVITFEELYALFRSRDISIAELEESGLDSVASPYGRCFARSGGVSEAVAEALKESGNGDFELRPIVCSGIDECRKALIQLQKGVLKGNFIEGMACIGGCVNGAGCLTHIDRSADVVNAFGNESENKTIKDSLKRN